MWNTINNLSAGGKVAYDKAFDYFQYYFPFNKDSDIECINIDDNIEDYDNLQIEKYKNEKAHKRILPPVGLMEEYGTFFTAPTHIIDNIYLGSAFNAASYQSLKDLNIKVIFNITKEISNYYPNEFIYNRFNIYDNNKHSMGQYLEKVYQDIRYHQDNTEGNILIHCYMGASRSASVLIRCGIKCAT